MQCKYVYPCTCALIQIHIHIPMHECMCVYICMGIINIGGDARSEGTHVYDAIRALHDQNTAHDDPPPLLVGGAALLVCVRQRENEIGREIYAHPAFLVGCRSIGVCVCKRRSVVVRMGERL